MNSGTPCPSGLCLLQPAPLSVTQPQVRRQACSQSDGQDPVPEPHGPAAWPQPLLPLPPSRPLVSDSPIRALNLDGSSHMVNSPSSLRPAHQGMNPASAFPTPPPGPADSASRPLWSCSRAHSGLRALARPIMLLQPFVPCLIQPVSPSSLPRQLQEPQAQTPKRHPKASLQVSRGRC